MPAKAATLIFLLVLAACATAGDQTRLVLRSPPDVPPRARIEAVPFVRQTDGNCGPSSVAMTMQWAGVPVSAEALAPEVMITGKNGSVQSDLISASRRHGLLATPITGMPSLLKEIAAGHPVIVLENLGFSWIPQWHYSVAVGYDLPEQELILHRGETPFQRLSLNYFERGWRMADYWGLVILPPRETAATATELDHLRGAVGLEQTGHLKEAEQVYRNIFRKWPGSLGALIGLGNLAYKNKNYAAAVAYLKEATRLHPESSVARHNLRVAEDSEDSATSSFRTRRPIF